ncbi:hypothetical protein K9L16_00330 [Candidatus Pacearchaeota archaeon]|nr:hypothetical protein [Candidatus Pacearchaeota archaeon]
MKKFGKLFLMSVLVMTFSLTFVMAVVPYGAGSVTQENTTTAPADEPANHSAIAGNVTEITITGFSTTQSWQGYFGNVSGTVQLADVDDNVMYNWSLASPEGEVYASTADTITWASMECFNFTADGATLETAFNISSDDVDGVNETFAANNHDLFYTNNIEIAENSCMSVQLYDSTGGSVDQNFEEVLLWDGSEVVFTSILEEASVDGFDNKDHDFQMLVLEDGHGTDTATTMYYFYIELE